MAAGQVFMVLGDVTHGLYRMADKEPFPSVADVSTCRLTH